MGLGGLTDDDHSSSNDHPNNPGGVGDSILKDPSRANLTEAPTNAGTAIAEANRNSKLTEHELDFVTLVAQYWGTHGVLLSRELAASDFDLDSKLYTKYFGSERVLGALEELGVSIRSLQIDTDDRKQVWKQKVLTPKQLMVANMMLDLNDTRSDKKKLQDSGVATSVWQAWLRNPVFQEYVRSRSEVLLTDNIHEGHLALMDKVKMGDVKAISLYYEITNRFTPKTQADVQTDQIQFKTLITKFVEIIIDEVDDPQVAARLADRLKTLVSTNNIVQAIVEPEPIRQPEIMPNREMTPELEAWMNKGGGMDT